MIKYVHLLYRYRCVQYIIVIALPWVPRLRPIRSTDVTHAELWREAEVFRHPEAGGRPGDVELENHISKNYIQNNCWIYR